MVYRRDVWCSTSGDEISNPGLNCTIASLHCLFITWIFISVVYWYVARAQFNLFNYLSCVYM